METLEVGRLSKVPFNATLGRDFFAAHYAMQTSSRSHALLATGDPDVLPVGFVYVPMQGVRRQDDARREISREATSAITSGDSVLEKAPGQFQANAGSVAISPATGPFFSSSDNPNVIYRYHVDPGSNTFHLIGDGPIPTLGGRTAVYDLRGAQGMAFSPNGDKLYIAADNDAVIAFRVSPHKLQYEFKLNVESCYGCVPEQEYEGMDVRDTDFVGGPNMGQLHLFVYERSGGLDSDSGHAWFKHVRVTGSKILMTRSTTTAFGAKPGGEVRPLGGRGGERGGGGGANMIEMAARQFAARLPDGYGSTDAMSAVSANSVTSTIRPLFIRQTQQ